MNEQTQIAELLKSQYHGKKLPLLLSPLTCQSRGGWVTLETGTIGGQLAVASVRYHAGQFEFRGYAGETSSFQTLEALEKAAADLTASVGQAERDRWTQRARQRMRTCNR